MITKMSSNILYIGMSVAYNKKNYCIVTEDKEIISDYRLH